MPGCACLGLPGLRGGLLCDVKDGFCLKNALESGITLSLNRTCDRVSTPWKTEVLSENEMLKHLFVESSVCGQVTNFLETFAVLSVLQQNFGNKMVVFRYNLCGNCTKLCFLGT